MIDEDKRLQFGMISNGDRRILLMGIPAACWDDLKSGNGQDVNLAPMGIPISLFIFGAPDTATAAKFIEQSAAAMGITFEDQASEPAAEAVSAEIAQTEPVDRSDVTLADGSPVTEDHRDTDPATGMQKGYVVLSDTERAKGFVRPYRDAYRHQTCGAITTMARKIAETYAVKPDFYSGTYCSTCHGHFPVGEDGEFTWYEMDGREGPKVGT